MSATESVPRLFGAAEVCLGRQRSPQHDVGPHMVPYLRAANVKDGALDLNDVKSMNFEPSEQKTFALRAGDILITEGSGSLGAVGAAAVWNGELPGTVCFQNTLVRLRPRLGISEGRYLGWWARAAYGSGEFASIASGASIYHISSERVKSLPAPLPALDEQRRIADFLDAETQRIEALTRSYEATKVTIAERTQLLVDELVVAEGEPVPLKYFVRFREGPGIMAADFRNQGTPLIRIAGLQDGEVTLRGANYLDHEMVASRWRQFRLRLGDYVISGSATMGAVSLVRDVEVVGAIPYTGLITLRPREPSVVMEYVAIAMNSSMFMGQIDLLKAGAAMQHFGPTHLAQISLPFPTSTRQNDVASAASDIRGQASKIKESIDRQLALLAERRQALITAAVTGQIDVTTARGVGV